MLNMKRVGVVVGVVVLLAMFGHKNDGSSSSSAPSAASVSAPSCKTDWKLCADNSDMANNNAVYERARFECKYEANKLAKYGE
jgi:hypothetical protein